MRNASKTVLQGNLLTVEPCDVAASVGVGGGQSFLLNVTDGSNAKVLMASLAMLDSLLGEKVAAVRTRRMEELVDVMAERLVVPSTLDVAMAQRLAARRAAVLNEFGYVTAEQLADANRSQAALRSALADNWRKRRQVFAVPHPDRSVRDREVYPAFQFEDHRPIRAVHGVLEAFAGQKSPWSLALWFTSNNGLLADTARPVDLLRSDPAAVIDAAQRDAKGPAA